MKYTELKESLKKTDDKVYLYTVTKKYDGTIEVSERAEEVSTIELDYPTEEIEIIRFKAGGSESPIRYLNTDFGAFYCDTPDKCSGWALTENEKRDILIQIMSDLKAEKLVKLREQFNREGITKEDLLSIIEDM